MRNRCALEAAALAEPNWHKQVAIGAWIFIGLTAILIALAVLSYVHPADPAHPMSLDFLSHSITVSPWLAVACLRRTSSPNMAPFRWREQGPSFRSGEFAGLMDRRLQT
jgi:hypothetical protein